MPDALYDTDILSWSEQQAALLRRAEQGERVNGLDWPNLIEEIEAVGRSEVRAVVSLLEQALAHMLKATGWPGHAAVRHWRAEATVFLRRAARDYRPSMRQHLDLDGIFEDARLAATIQSIDDQPPQPLPLTCPLTLDELLSRPDDIAPLIARLGAAGAG